MRPDYGRCPRCGENDWLPHSCKPMFEYQIPEWHDEDEWLSVRARDYSDAAEKACEESDYESADYTVISRGYLNEIRIRDADGNVRRFSIQAESVPHYYAEEMEG